MPSTLLGLANAIGSEDFAAKKRCSPILAFMLATQSLEIELNSKISNVTLAQTASTAVTR